jgi:hypothetical protein
MALVFFKKNCYNFFHFFQFQLAGFKKTEEIGPGLKTGRFTISFVSLRPRQLSSVQPTWAGRVKTKRRDYILWYGQVVTDLC